MTEFFEEINRHFEGGIPRPVVKETKVEAIEKEVAYIWGESIKDANIRQLDEFIIGVNGENYISQFHKGIWTSPRKIIKL